MAGTDVQGGLEQQDPWGGREDVPNQVVGVEASRRRRRCCLLIVAVVLFLVIIGGGVSVPFVLDIISQSGFNRSTQLHPTSGPTVNSSVPPTGFNRSTRAQPRTISDPMVNTSVTPTDFNRSSYLCTPSEPTVYPFIGRVCFPGPRTKFSVTGSGRFGTIQSYVVPSTWIYLIQAGGARGGSHSYSYGYFPGTYYGGRGATMGGLFHLTTGTVLNIVVGQRGGNSVEVEGGRVTTRTAAELGVSVKDHAGTGGGGGSFVYTTNNTLLIAAGGGGGASAGYNGVAGHAGTNGTASNGSNPSTVRAGGHGGCPGACNSASACYHGGVGAGWNGWGCSRLGSEHGERGGSRLQGWVGGRAGEMNSGYNGGPPPGAVGGFGGGGGGSEDNGASGGGGGYSGGGSGTHEQQAGGGGGSYCSGTRYGGLTGGNWDDNGFVKIAEC